MQQVSQTNFKVDTELPNKRAAQNKPSMVGRCFHLLNEKCEWKNIPLKAKQACSFIRKFRAHAAQKKCYKFLQLLPGSTN